MKKQREKSLAKLKKIWYHMSRTLEYSWIAQPVERVTVNHDVAGSNPASGANGLFVKWLRHRPFTAGSRVRISHRSPWAISSAGRASALQAECQQFDPVIAHQRKAVRMDCFFIVFQLAFPQSCKVMKNLISYFTYSWVFLNSSAGRARDC